MLDEHDYQMAWSIYLICAGVMWLSVWRLSRHLWFWVADISRAFSAVALFMPFRHDDEAGQTAPALFMLAFEWIAGNTGSGWAEVAIQLLLSGIGATIVLLLARWLWSLWIKRAQPAASPPPTPGFKPGQRSR